MLSQEIAGYAARRAKQLRLPTVGGLGCSAELCPLRLIQAEVGVHEPADQLLVERQSTAPSDFPRRFFGYFAVISEKYKLPIPQLHGAAPQGARPRRLGRHIRAELQLAELAQGRRSRVAPRPRRRVRIRLAAHGRRARPQLFRLSNDPPLTFIDSSGAGYRLDVNTNGGWLSRESVYFFS